LLNVFWQFIDDLLNADPSKTAGADLYAEERKAILKDPAREIRLRTKYQLENALKNDADRRSSATKRKATIATEAVAATKPAKSEDEDHNKMGKIVEDEELLKMFSDTDANNDEKLTKKEMGDFVAAQGGPVEIPDEQFIALDTNSNGFVSKKEFFAFFQAMRELKEKSDGD
jgi:hypothetical protein